MSVENAGAIDQQVRSGNSGIDEVNSPGLVVQNLKRLPFTAIAFFLDQIMKPGVVGRQ